MAKTYKYSLDQVFAVIDGERDYQEIRWPGHRHPVGSFLTYMNYYLIQACSGESTNDASLYAAGNPLRKFLALAVACMEENGYVTRGRPVASQGVSTRHDVYQAIREERDYQDGCLADGGEIGEELTILRFYLRRADEAWSSNKDDSSALDQIRKLAAITARIFQSNGVPARVTTRHRPIVGQAY